MNVGAVAGRERVEAAIAGAARATGVDFDFLLRTAKRESSLNPVAQAKTSSAAGLFQFVEQTWLATVKTHGAKHGYAHYADMIQRGSNGRLSVSGDERRKVLDLRLDATAASLMAGELAAESASYLRGRIGREPSGGELYAAHFLGPAGAAKLVNAHERSPTASAAALFPSAAGANRSIFYGGDGARSVAEVYAANLTRTGDKLAAPVRAVVDTAVNVVREAVRPAAAAAAAVAAPVAHAVEEVATAAERAPDAMRSALHRAERARRDALLIDMILGDTAGAGRIGAGGLPMELLTLLSDARER